MSGLIRIKKVRLGFRYRYFLWVWLTALMLSGCSQAAKSLYPPCCYSGEVTVTQLSDLEVELEQGGRVPLNEVLPDLVPQQSIFKRVLPFRRTYIREVQYDRSRRVMEKYDSNFNTVMEKPELVRLILEQGMEGRNIGVKALFHDDTKVRAIATSNADLGGLIVNVFERRELLDHERKQLFIELEWLGIEQAFGDGPDFYYMGH